MRGHLQQGSSQLVAHSAVYVGAVATLVYLLTMDRSASWWDCGEFIATGWTLGVGHPPGAPFYQLVTHLFMLLSFGNPLWVAPLSNAVSAICGGVTVGLLYTSLQELKVRRLGALIGALCYLFCDTAWFSAVESEVYSMAMLFCAAEVYLALRYRRTGNARLLLLIGLLLGLGICVHLMTLLVVPALLLIIAKRVKDRFFSVLFPFFFFFLLGLTPYVIIPIRAAANPPINEMGESFSSYLHREQYQKAPLYPRLWRERDSANWVDWNAGRTDLLGNTVYYTTYQLGYMYGRYLMYNYIGRENLAYRKDASHFSIFNFQYSIFILPFLLGLWGLLRHRRRSRIDFWVVMLLFLFGGVLLNLYLNHPCYEPRERDYVYILSFYAFALWIGIGADELLHRHSFLFPLSSFLSPLSSFLSPLSSLLFIAPLTMAVGNWSDHDRSRCQSVHDIALNHLNSCDTDAILITLGDNDTFPLWYLQQVEHQRTDISIYNVGLTGWHNILGILEDNNMQRPVYFTHYFYQRFSTLFPGRLHCSGFCWQLLPDSGQPPTSNLHPPASQWHITPHEYIDPVSASFLDIWRHNTGQNVRPRADI